MGAGAGAEAGCCAGAWLESRYVHEANPIVLPAASLQALLGNDRDRDRERERDRGDDDEDDDNDDYDRRGADSRRQPWLQRGGKSRTASWAAASAPVVETEALVQCCRIVEGVTPGSDAHVYLAAELVMRSLERFGPQHEEYRQARASLVRGEVAARRVQGWWVRVERGWLLRQMGKAPGGFSDVLKCVGTKQLGCSRAVKLRCP